MIFNVKNINYYVNFYNDLVSVSREDYVLYFTVIRSLAIVNYGELNLNIYDKDIVTLLVKQYRLWLDVEKETGLTTNDLRQLLETLRGKDNA